MTGGPKGQYETDDFEPASRLFKRDGTSDRDSGSSQDPAPDEGGQVARPSMDEKKMQSKPPSDEFNTFACASDNEDSAISNITLSGTGSDRKRPLKKKCKSCLIYFLRDANVSPVFSPFLFPSPARLF